jgi:hypothetical protein
MESLTIREVLKGPIDLCCAWYLMLSFLYYKHDISLVRDTHYDQLCKRLAIELDQVTHPHRHLLDPAALEAGSGYHIDHYPLLTQHAAWHLYEVYRSP